LDKQQTNQQETNRRQSNITLNIRNYEDSPNQVFVPLSHSSEIKDILEQVQKRVEIVSK